VYYIHAASHVVLRLLNKQENYTMKNNETMYTKVMEKLNFEPSLDATDITVSIQGDGDIVILGGTVESFYEKLAAERAVKSLMNVRTIANEITVDLSIRYKKTDAEIAKEVTNAIKSNTITAPKNIQAIVKDGIVTLTGAVDWYYQKSAAFNAINKLFGIKAIINNIEVKPIIVIDSSKVKSQITKEFERHARIDAEKIKVTVEGKKIILTGKVNNYDEIDEAETAAWSVSGVEKVDNKLTIDW
ncbi:MAG: BON domain-containing protein, partial [Rickettsiaceae bacterium]|nr:BON domain-containing protein [Rickettsiaceae bacterium]